VVGLNGFLTLAASLYWGSTWVNTFVSKMRILPVESFLKMNPVLGRPCNHWRPSYFVIPSNRCQNGKKNSEKL
jgi:hypothetical protein